MRPSRFFHLSKYVLNHSDNNYSDNFNELFMNNGQGNYLCSGSNTGTNKKKISSLNSSNGHSIGSNSSNGKSKNKKPGKKLVKHKQKCRGRPKKKI